MHTFRAWMDERGSNKNSAHRRFCEGSPGHGDPLACRHFRLFDLDTDRCRGVVRVIRRRHPVYFRVMLGPSYRTIFQVGRKS